MSASRRSVITFGATLGVLGAVLASAAWAAKAPAQLAIPSGSRVGVISLLDAEVTQFQGAKRIQDSFLKTYPVGWNSGAMLAEAVRERLAQLGFVPVPLAPPDALKRAREECFLNTNLAKGLSKECLAPYAQLAASQPVSAFIVLGPGLNNSTHAQGGRRKDLPEYLRGWCLISGEGYSPPLLLNLTELLLIGVTEQGALLIDREWGGELTRSWSGYQAEAKGLSGTQFAQLQPLYAELLKEQTGALFAHLAAAH